MLNIALFIEYASCFCQHTSVTSCMYYRTARTYVIWLVRQCMKNTHFFLIQYLAYLICIFLDMYTKGICVQDLHFWLYQELDQE